jgi:hypothetical protein
MKTKKLVLGFCVLAAVAGSAPQVFCEDISPRDMLNCISDPRRRDEAQYRLAATKERLQANTAELASMCNNVIGLVSKIRESERRAYILGTIANGKEREIKNEVECRQNDLTRAKSALKGARYFRRLRTAIVTWRKSKLEKAEQKKTLILAQVASLRGVAADITETAKQDRAAASALNAKLAALLTEIATAELGRHARSLGDDVESFKRGELSVHELEMMEGRLAEGAAVFDETISRDSNLERVRNAIECRQLPCDYDWFCREVGGGRRLYRKLTAMYQPREINLFLNQSFRQIDRLQHVFNGSYRLETEVRASLHEAERDATFALINGVEPLIYPT